MQPHEQVQFLRAVGVFINDQIKAATQPLLDRIAVLEGSLSGVQGDLALQATQITPPTLHEVEDMIERSVMTCKMEALSIARDTIAANLPKQGEPGVPGKDGMNVTVEDVEPIVAREIAKQIAEISVISVTGATIDKDGALVLIFSDGSSKTLGTVIGRDVDMQCVIETIRAEVAKFPVPKNGKDGLGFDDLSVDYDGARTLTLKFTRGEDIKNFEIKLSHPLDRGVWRPGKYEKGDVVTLGGSAWIAQCDTEVKPETNSDWRLAVKRGDRGKDGEPGRPGEPGPPGKNGRDLTQLGPDGRKW